MADRIERLRRAEKELLANVSHELRTPLARIRVVLELAIDGEPAAMRRYLSEIAEDVGEVEQLLEDIITAARLDLRGGGAHDPYPRLRLTATQLVPEVEALVARFCDAHPERPVGLRVDVHPVVSLDRVMFKHVVSNVLDNADHYSPGELPIELAVIAEHAAAGRLAVVEVRDRGQGIDPSDVPHVFDPFFRADRSRTRSTGGAGLGLTLARRIVEAHGGTITLESQRGQGTTVRIALPFLPDGTLD
jgi:signal transduction histidine kinase